MKEQVEDLASWDFQQRELESHLNTEVVNELNEGIEVDDAEEEDEAKEKGKKEARWRVSFGNRSLATL